MKLINEQQQSMLRASKLQRRSSVLVVFTRKKAQAAADRKPTVRKVVGSCSRASPLVGLRRELVRRRKHGLQQC